MLSVAAEFEYVPLRDSHVLKDLPGRVWNALRLPVYKLDRKIFYNFIEAYMRAAASEQIKQMLAQRSIILAIHLNSLLHGSSTILPYAPGSITALCARPASCN